MQQRLVEAWPEIEDSLKAGAVVTIEEAAVRIRQLPIAKDS
jgi:hypothetical protein